ncbi:MAG: hypothetical protein ACYC9R_13135, partial [Nitrosotalea sp.]
MADPFASMIPLSPNQTVSTYANLPQMPLNANTGYEAGVNAADAQNQQNMNLQGQQLDYQNAQNLYQQSLLDNPVRAAQRALAISQATAENVPYQNGTMAQVAQTGAESKLAGNISSRTTSQLENMMGQVQFYQAVHTAMTDPSTTGPADPVAMDGKYQAFKSLAKKSNLGIPDSMLPDHWTPEVDNEYAKAASIGISTLPFIQKSLAAKAGYEAKQQQVETTGKYELASAAAGQMAANQRAENALPPDRKISDQIDNFVTNKQPVPVDLIKQYGDSVLTSIRGSPQGAAFDSIATSQASQAQANSRTRMELIKRFNLPKNATIGDIRTAYLNDEVQKAVTEKIDAKMNGKLVVARNGAVGVYQDGKLVPKTGTNTTPSFAQTQAAATNT